MVFGWGWRKKKKSGGSQVMAAAAEAAGIDDDEETIIGKGERPDGGGRRGPPTEAEEAELIDPTTVRVSDLPMMLEAIAGTRDRSLVAGAASLRDAMVPRLERIDEVLGELEEDDLGTDDADRRVQAIVERAKRQIISIVGSEVRAPLPDIETPEDAVALAEATARMLKKAGDVLGRHSRFLHAYARKYSSRIEPVLKDAEDDYVDLKVLVDSRAATAEISRSILDDAERIGRAGRDAERLRARASELESRLAGLRGRERDAAARIEEARSSPEHKEIGRLRGDLEAVRGRREAARRAAADRFTRISKPLSRYEYVSAMDKDKMALLRAVIDDPFGAVASSGAAAVSEVLGAAKKAVEGGSVSVKDRPKAVRMLGEEIGRLASYEEAAGAMAREEASIKEGIAAADTGRLGALEDELARSRAEREDTEAKASQMRAEAGEADGRVPVILGRLESSVSEVTGIQYTVLPDEEPAGAAAG